ncbi:MAG: hypothetical protein ACTSWQ_05810, partial [Candidatus Thorarchaeota archaeon]
MKYALIISVMLIASIFSVGATASTDELSDSRILEILLTRVNAIINYLFGDMPTGCAWANPLCSAHEQCIDNSCTGEVIPDPAVCIDSCGDGICQDIVCTGTGCPCVESAQTCSADCAPVSVDTTAPQVVINYWNGSTYLPLQSGQSIELPQSYPLFSVSVLD